MAGSGGRACPDARGRAAVPGDDDARRTASSGGRRASRLFGAAERRGSQDATETVE